VHVSTCIKFVTYVLTFSHYIVLFIIVDMFVGMFMIYFHPKKLHAWINWFIICRHETE
jgi:hypothetical protein